VVREDELISKLLHRGTIDLGGMRRRHLAILAGSFAKLEPKNVTLLMQNVTIFTGF